MATSKALTVPHLAGWAMRKGIQVLGTGDFTHPQWRRELRENLVRDDHNGLYCLKSQPQADGETMHLTRQPYFCLQTEISCIYKRHGKTRKVHNLVFMPDLEAAERFSKRLEQIGNLASDGRPILGLDSRNLLEIALESSSDAVFIPAHIWTPWFALFGSKSGFNDIRDCYGDLTDHIFALETGLSSDPPMNRLLSCLDNYALISNSDAHSGINLGREANLFEGAPSWDGMFGALKSAAKRENSQDAACRFLGTLEFYPEEGKYHLDGHRACGIVMDPRIAREAGDRCPVCGKPLTIGVLHRVLDLADRNEAPALPNEPEAAMLVPLHEVVGEILASGPATKKVERKCEEIITCLGPELDVLCQIPEDEVRAYWEPLGEAVSRIRARAIFLEPGFDGQYGKISIFGPGELGQAKA